MRSIVSNDANQRSPLEEEGFVSNNTEVPCRGHLGFYAIFAGTVPYEELVSKGRELGIPGYGALEPYDCPVSVRTRFKLDERALKTAGQYMLNRWPSPPALSLDAGMY